MAMGFEYADRANTPIKIRLYIRNDSVELVLVTTFSINNPKYNPVDDSVFDKKEAIYKVPILPACAIIDSRLEMNNSIHVDAGYAPPKYRLLDDGVAVFASSVAAFVGNTSGVLTIYYNGIKDHKLLFPHVEDNSLRARLGQFAEEASKAFENQSWISCCLMVGGVLEGLLYNEFGDYRFKDLIRKANKRGFITSEEGLLIDDVRLARNRIHASQHNEAIINRQAALELSTAYDRLIKRDWCAEE